MRFLLLLPFLLSCGIEEELLPKPTNQLTIETEELRTYVDMFERDSAIYGDAVKIEDLTIVFGETDMPDDNSITLGRCYRSSSATPKIVIDSRFWKTFSNTDKMLLMYHELGHCVLNRAHIEGYGNSIMNPMLMSSKDFNLDKEYFLTELFDLNYKNDWLLLHSHEHKNCNH